MSLTAPEDAASLLEQFVHDVANTPAEIAHLLDEIQAKDQQIFALRDDINKRDATLQKWVRVNGGHALNPKEESLSRVISDCYDKCEILQAEKCGLSEKALIILERQIKRLDVGLRHLAQTGDFPADWGGPTLLGRSGAVTGVSIPVAGGAVPLAHGPLQAISGNAGTSGTPNVANAAQIRIAQTAARPTASGTQTPTALPRSQRESSSEANKRRRLNATLGALPAASSNLRQSSLGPGTPKASTPAPATAGSRAGSVQPSRPAVVQTKKAPSSLGMRKLAPPTNPSAARKRDRVRTANKKGADRRRQLKSDRATPSTNASATSDSDDSASPTPSSLPRSQTDGTSDRKRERVVGEGGDDGDVEDDEEDGEDDAIYCLCQRRSYGEMIACDNDECQYQWFHFGCVGMKEQPSGEWLCPSCIKLPRNQNVKSE